MNIKKLSNSNCVNSFCPSVMQGPLSVLGFTLCSYNIGRMPGFEPELLPARCATNELHTSLIKLLNTNYLQIKTSCFTFCLRRVSNRTWLCLLIYRLRSMSTNLKINKTRSREANIVPSTAPSIKFIPLKI